MADGLLEILAENTEGGILFRCPDCGKEAAILADSAFDDGGFECSKCGSQYSKSFVIEAQFEHGELIEAMDVVLDKLYMMAGSYNILHYDEDEDHYVVTERGAPMSPSDDRRPNLGHDGRKRLRESIRILEDTLGKGRNEALGI